MWQALRSELHPRGIEIVTVAMDTGGVDAAGRWIDEAKPEHPSLIDEAHALGALFGVVNVPSGIWIDEDGGIVRPPEPAWPGKSMFREIMKNITLPEDADPYVVRSLAVTAGIKVEPERYLAAVRDWAANGAASRFVLRPDEVIARSRPRPLEESLASAYFELGQHLWRAGAQDDAVEHFKAAHALQPENWTYRRQAWQFVSPILQQAGGVYGTDWATEAERMGPENYYVMAPDMA